MVEAITYSLFSVFFSLTFPEHYVYFTVRDTIIMRVLVVSHHFNILGWNMSDPAGDYILHT